MKKESIMDIVTRADSAKSGFKVLTEVDKAHLRPEELLGTIERVNKSFNVYDTEKNRFFPKEFSFSEAFFRLFEEAVTNSVDEHERHGELTEVRVKTSDGFITVHDNGGGYPQEKYEFSGESKYAPEWILTKLNSGTNFEDNGRVTIGMNGCGISLVNFFSEVFELDTANGESRYIQTFLSHSKKNNEQILKKTKSKHTLIRFKPDLSLFNLDESIYDEYKELFIEYLRNLSVVYPKVRFFFNDEKVVMRRGEFVSAMVQNILCKHVSPEAEIFIGLSDTCNRSVTVNSKPISYYVEFDGLVNYIYSQAREILNRRMKTNVATNGWFRDNISVVAFFKGTNARFKNQTKDILVKVTYSDFSFSNLDAIKCGKIIANNPKVSEMFSEHFNARDNSRAEVVIKNVKKTYIPKLVEATSRNSEEKVILLTEGDSALGQFNSVRNPKTMSLFPLKGKPSNVFNQTLAQVTSSDKYMHIIGAIGLGDKNSLRHGKCYIASDQDPDGLHIRLLLIQFFAKFFPWFIEEGRLFILEAPLYEYKTGKEIKYSKEKPPEDAINVKYFKGLGSMSKNATKSMINEPILVKIEDAKEIMQFFSSSHDEL